MQDSAQIIRQMKFFDLYSRLVWPLHRKFAGRYITPRCIRCYLSAECSPLDGGICDECRGSTQVIRDDSKTLEKELAALFREIAARDIPYHAVVLFSGGKDSIYLLHRLKRDFPELRLVALTIDNTFMSPVAMSNARAVVQKLGIDHFIGRVPAEFMERMFSYAFTHLNAGGCAGTVDQCDGEFIMDSGRNFAAQRKIPLVIAGLSRTQVERIFKIRTFETSPVQECLRRTHVAELPLTDIFEEKDLHYWWDGLQFPPEVVPRVIFPFYAWNLAEHVIQEEVASLRIVAKGAESPLVTNNLMVPLMGVVDIAKLGYSSFEPEFARMARLGRTKGKKWLYTFELLEYCARTGFMMRRLVEPMLKRLALRKRDLGIGT